MVERNTDRGDAEPAQTGQRALIALLLDDHGISARQQRLVDEIERLQRARYDQEVIGAAADAGVALQLCRKKFAQTQVALRPVGEAVGRERPALALEDRLDRRDQPLDRDLLG